jgi:hypothetical protein
MEVSCRIHSGRIAVQERKANTPTMDEPDEPQIDLNIETFVCEVIFNVREAQRLLGQEYVGQVRQ